MWQSSRAGNHCPLPWDALPCKAESGERPSRVQRWREVVCSGEQLQFSRQNELQWRREVKNNDWVQEWRTAAVQNEREWRTTAVDSRAVLHCRCFATEGVQYFISIGASLGSWKSPMLNATRALDNNAATTQGRWQWTWHHNEFNWWSLASLEITICSFVPSRTTFFSSVTKLKSFVGVIGLYMIERSCYRSSSCVYNAMVFLLSGHKPLQKTSNNRTHLIRHHYSTSESANIFVWFWSSRPGKGGVGKDFISDLGENSIYSNGGRWQPSWSFGLCAKSKSN